MIKKIASLFLLLPLLVGFGCTSVGGGGRADGGLFLSTDGGVTWMQRAFIRTEENKTISIDRTDVLDLDFHPTDSKRLYLTVRPGGVYTTTNRGETWTEFLPLKDPVTAFAVQAKNENIFFAVVGNAVIRTNDGGANWSTIFTEATPDVALEDVIVDRFDPNRVFLVRSNGTVTRSLNGGSSWAPMTTLPDVGHIIHFSPHAKDTRIMTVLTGRGLFRSVNLGATWVQLDEALAVAGGNGAPQAVAFDAQNTARIVAILQNGLFETTDGGTSWKKLELLTDPSVTPVTSAAIDPTDGRKLYYTAAGTLYHSPDNGRSWVTRSLPTTRTPRVLDIDPRGGALHFYLGATRS